MRSISRVKSFLQPGFCAQGSNEQPSGKMGKAGGQVKVTSGPAMLSRACVLTHLLFTPLFCYHLHLLFSALVNGIQAMSLYENSREHNKIQVFLCKILTVLRIIIISGLKSIYMYIISYVRSDQKVHLCFTYS